MYFHKYSAQWFNDSKVTFVQQDINYNRREYAYQDKKDLLNFKRYKVRNSYIDFNSSVCLYNGTNINATKRTKKSVWKCICEQYWHGADCSQPEMIWRALLSSRKKIAIKGPRKFARLVIYIVRLEEFYENILEIIMNELNDVVDLFVLVEENNCNVFQRKIKSGHFATFNKKIKHINSDYEAQSIWNKVKNDLNLNKDDLIFINSNFEIPNKYVILFLKFYDNWPEPITLRLRWTVYGFFWRHPNKTKTEGFACTVHCMDNLEYNNQQNVYKHTQQIDRQFTIGDLNHFGGWYCELCNYPIQIIEYFKKKSDKTLNLDNLKLSKIDITFFEDLIENGIYIDNKMELERSRKYLEMYYSPYYVSLNPWKYDYLLINLYSKLEFLEE